VTDVGGTGAGGPPAVAVARGTDSYRPGRPIEVVAPEGAAGAPVVLFWHGSGPDERDALVPLATRVASYGVLALVPDWRSDDLDVGADELVDSIAFASASAARLGGDPGRVVLAGWSLGASAAADIALHPGIADGWRPAGLVGLGGGYDRSPFGGPRAPAPTADVVAGGAGRPALLVHGTTDTVIPPERSAVATAAFLEAGWHATLHQLGTDHAGVIGTVYDRALRRCVPSPDPDRLSALAQVGAQVAGVALGTEPAVGARRPGTESQPARKRMM